ncbi:MAG: hypothetical protein AABY22_09230, partial [Nanoarchaeota archaeon]
SLGKFDYWCFQHNPDVYFSMYKNKGIDRSIGWESCNDCVEMKTKAGDTGIDFYYFIVADSIKVKPTWYPKWGVINENGVVIRSATRMKRKKDSKDLITAIAHVLVYKTFGKLYLK